MAARPARRPRWAGCPAPPSPSGSGSHRSPSAATRRRCESGRTTVARAVVGPMPAARSPTRSAGPRARRRDVAVGPVRRAVLRRLYPGRDPPRGRRASAWSTTRTSSSSPSTRRCSSSCTGAGEQGWEPELLPWWRAFCRSSTSVLELGTNVGYFAVQGGRAAPGGALRRRGAAPVLRRDLPDPPRAQRRDLGGGRRGRGGRGSRRLVGARCSSRPTRRPPRPSRSCPPDTELPDGHGAGRRRRPRRAGRRRPVAARRRGPDQDGRRGAGARPARRHAGAPATSAGRPLFVEVLPGTVQLRAVLAELCATDGYRCYALSRQGLVELDGDAAGHRSR